MSPHTTPVAVPVAIPVRHTHVFDEGNPLAERDTTWAVLLTAAMMVAEIVAGHLYHSMALLADGWHMSSHTVALGLSVAAYVAARRLAHDARFTFGTWKIEVLGGFTSALLLLGVAGWMLWQSVDRLLAPVPIRFDDALRVAVAGLAVNLVCAWLLKGHAHHHGHGHGEDPSHGHSQGHDHGPAAGHAHHHGDLNQRAAYLHVLADAATSVLAIAALVAGRLWGADWLDPVMGVAGAVLVAVWATGLLRESARVLLDAEMDAPVADEVREVIASGPVAADLCDLHVWRVGKGRYACIVSVVTAADVGPDYFKQRLAVHEELVHVTVEVNHRRAAPPTGLQPA